jgi:ribosomal protein L12E/L44/L45/RPP1/RPP2
MQYLAAYTLASLSGKEPSKSLINSASVEITNILKATGGKFDEAEVTKVVNTLKGKKLEDVILMFNFS